MRIGVDIDAVLNYSPKVMLECGTKFCAETGKGKLLDAGAHDLSEKFGWDKETRREFWYQYAWKQMWEYPAQHYAAEVIDKMRADGHEVWIVTGRSLSDMRVAGMPDDWNWEDVTRRWLEKNGIIYDGFGFGQQDKGRFCRDNGIVVMVEDNMCYLSTFDKETKVLIFDYPYNRGMKLPNSERVYSWYDIYNKVKGMM